MLMQNWGVFNLFIKKVNQMRLSVFIYITFILLFSVNAQRNYTENGEASYYGDEFNGKKTASGEI